MKEQIKHSSRRWKLAAVVIVATIFGGFFWQKSLFFSSPQAAPQSTPDDLEAQLKQLWQQGADAKHRKDYAGARRAWQQALKLKPGHPGIQEAINGLPSGGNSISNSNLFSSIMGYQITPPEGWSVNYDSPMNTHLTDVIFTVKPTNEFSATLIVETSTETSKRSLEDVDKMQVAVAPHFKWLNRSYTTVDGLPALSTVATYNSPAGLLIQRQLVVLRNGAAYSFIGSALQSDDAKYEPVFAKAFGSVHWTKQGTAKDKDYVEFFATAAGFFRGAQGELTEVLQTYGKTKNTKPLRAVAKKADEAAKMLISQIEKHAVPPKFVTNIVALRQSLMIGQTACELLAEGDSDKIEKGKQKLEQSKKLMKVVFEES